VLSFCRLYSFLMVFLLSPICHSLSLFLPVCSYFTYIILRHHTLVSMRPSVQQGLVFESWMHGANSHSKVQRECESVRESVCVCTRKRERDRPGSTGMFFCLSHFVRLLLSPSSPSPCRLFLSSPRTHSLLMLHGARSFLVSLSSQKSHSLYNCCVM
jgi:putative component of membrane protein insertase Oxa1/YidC/SpoIIIJ protein YidD